MHTDVTTTERVTAQADVQAAAAAEHAEHVDYFPGLDLSVPGKASPTDARAMSKVLFVRMAELEAGTHEFQYVRNTLIELNMALVKFAAGRFRSRSEPMEDMVQVGTIGLIKAIDRFDPDRGIEFTTFALPTSPVRSSGSSGTPAGRCTFRAGSRSCGWCWPGSATRWSR